MNNIKNIIFDLGGVFIDVDYLKTHAAFEALGMRDFDRYYMQDFANKLFVDLETGKVSNARFYESFREETNTAYSNDSIAKAWNAMLGDFRIKSVHLLRLLRKKYKLYLFSNTNSIHYTQFSTQFKTAFGKNIDDFFDKVYYSHLLHHRKPNASGFKYILEENNLLAAETLFVDDTPININAAKAVGLQTFLLSAPMQVEDMLL